MELYKVTLKRDGVSQTVGNVVAEYPQRIWDRLRALGWDLDDCEVQLQGTMKGLDSLPKRQTRAEEVAEQIARGIPYVTTASALARELAKLPEFQGR